MLSLLALVTALAASSFVSLAEAKACPPLGAVLPAPKAPSKNAAVKKAVKETMEMLQHELSSTMNASAISVGVKSIHEDDLLLNYHFTPPVYSGIGTKHIDEHTIYRLGSISKMMPALVAIQEEIDMEASVLKYLPELKDGKVTSPVDVVAWEDVTVRSLLSHLAGLATDTAQDLALFPSGNWTDKGLPEVPEDEVPKCSGLPPTDPCTKEDLIAEMHRRPPVYLPYTTPVYSNVAFALLGLIVEVVTGKDFNDVVAKNVYKVAGMKSTSFNGPVKSFSKHGFVPQGESTYDKTLGVYEEAGGMFSNTVDVLAFCDAILKHKLLPPAKTRQWMKPVTHTASLGLSVGAPWEIFRSNNLTSDGRVIDVYGKTGDLGMYHAILGLVADYGLSVSVLTGGLEVTGDPYAREVIFGTVLQHLLPALEKAGQAEATRSIVGTYTDEKTNSSLTLKLDGGPGLLIDTFTVRGYDVLTNINSFSLGALESGGASEQKPPPVDGRLYPTGISSDESDCKEGSAENVWRAYFDSTTDKKKIELNGQLFAIDGSCDSWFQIDRASYNLLSLAEFVAVQGGNGRVSKIKNPAFDVMLERKG